MPYIRNGWSSVKRQFPSVIILFLYQLLWGVFLYRLVNTAVVQVLHRYPDPPPHDLSRILFVIEGQNRFWQIPEVHHYLWIVIGMVLLRLLLTPLVQAGILYGLLPGEERAPGLPLFRGMQKFWKPVTLFYFIELMLILIPMLWLLPKAYASLSPILQGNGSHISAALIAMLYAVGWLCYSWFIRQTVLFLQFGYLFRGNAWPSLLLCWKHLLPGLGISFILAATCSIIFILFGTVSWIWTGLLALILQQAYPFFRSFFKIWKISSLYCLWQQKS
ncbi:hypothetical protein QNH46_00515 [Paenibacillus woosongensis]|uniref:DUF4013 domain-containing protein n=1 Tax=Paenibacillus woosongensis TaxID=307580 RepID=A0AA95I826_9BACL|nr:hypothetical protein [Paenibacillus woosongensis]WHX49228.1 hypothetical protein QNH46_00515 [Paenibacillus woosongensis]